MHIVPEYPLQIPNNSAIMYVAASTSDMHNRSPVSITDSNPRSCGRRRTAVEVIEAGEKRQRKPHNHGHRRCPHHVRILQRKYSPEKQPTRTQQTLEDCRGYDWPQVLHRGTHHCRTRRPSQFPKLYTAMTQLAICKNPSLHVHESSRPCHVT